MLALLKRLILLAPMCLGVIPSAGVAQPSLTIITGGSLSTEWELGNLMADTLGKSDGIKLIPATGIGGINNLQRMARQSPGSVSAFVAEDVAEWAQASAPRAAEVYAKFGKSFEPGPFGIRSIPKLPNIRLLGDLFVEPIYLVTRRDGPTESISGLKGLRVAVNGIYDLCRLEEVLRASGMSLDDIQAIPANGSSTDLLESGKIDAFFGGGANGILFSILRRGGRLVPIDKNVIAQLAQANSTLVPISVASEELRGFGPIDTVGYRVLWVTTESADSELVFNIAKDFYSDATRRKLALAKKSTIIQFEQLKRHPRLPLHPGVERLVASAASGVSANTNQTQSTPQPSEPSDYASAARQFSQWMGKLPTDLVNGVDVFRAAGVDYTKIIGYLQRAGVKTKTLHWTEVWNELELLNAPRMGLAFGFCTDATPTCKPPYDIIEGLIIIDINGRVQPLRGPALSLWFTLPDASQDKPLARYCDYRRGQLLCRISVSDVAPFNRMSQFDRTSRKRHPQYLSARFFSWNWSLTEENALQQCSSQPESEYSDAGKLIDEFNRSVREEGLAAWTPGDQGSANGFRAFKLWEQIVVRLQCASTNPSASRTLSDSAAKRLAGLRLNMK